MKLGYASPRKLLSEVSNRELVMWFGLMRTGSLEDDAMDERFAIVAAAAMNGPHFLKAGKRPYEALDFLPKRITANSDVADDIRAFFKNRGK